MIPATLTPSELGHADAWPADAAIYDTAAGAFLDRDEAALLSRGIEKARRHSLIFRPLAEVVPDVLFEGYNILSAPPKIGKTIIAHQLMIAVDMGRDWLGRPVQQGPVLFYGLEDSLASITVRERRLLGDGLTEFVTGGAGQLVVADAGPTPEDRLAHLVQQLHAGHHGTPWGLVVIDTAARFLGSGNANQDAYSRGLDLLGPLDRLGLRHHVAILGIHHDRKNNDNGDDFDAVSGGMSLTGTAQSLLALRRTRGGDTGVLAVYPRAAEERRFALEFEGGAWRLSPTLAATLAEEAAGARRDVLAVLLDHPTGLTLQDLVTHDKLRHRNYANLQQSLTRLRQDGKVRIESGVWSATTIAVTHPAATATDQTPPAAPAAAAPRAPAATAASLTPIVVDDPGTCDTCSGTPARLHTRTGTRHCRRCRPEWFRPPLGAAPPAAAAAPEPATPGIFRRPEWMPTPLAHPITVWNRLLEKSFRSKRVSLILHPYPRDEDIPEPFRKPGKGRPAPIHEGAHHWHNATIPAGTLITVIDRNGSYLGSMGTADIPIGALREHAGAGPTNESGAHLIDRWPAWTDPDLPHPGGARPRSHKDGPVWILTAQLKLMLPLTHSPGGAPGPLEPFTVIRSLTCRYTRLDTLQAELRDARTLAIDQGDTEAERFIKAIYSIGISTGGESGHNTWQWRPDWPPPLRGTFHSNIWRATKRARDHGLTIAAVKHTDELHIVGDPWTAFTQGRGLKEWKHKLTDDGQPLIYPWEPPRAK